MVEVIRFKKKQSPEMKKYFDETLLGKWHIIQPPTDYTACGQATDEYEIEKKEGKVTCKECLKIIKYYKKLKI